jgi:undecaprenyl-diphosphatase
MFLTALILGLVEGLTEFLPISSTGHLILAGALLRFTGEKAEVFEIAIQTGAILAVVLVFRARLGATLGSLHRSAVSRRFVLNVAVAFLPAVVLGLLFGKAIKAHLFNPVTVAMALVGGGLIILWVERWRKSARMAARAPVAPRVLRVEDMTPRDALKVGLLQCCALIPGVSRSGATIIGGVLIGLSRPVATEFSFFLAIPTLIGAGAYSLYKARDLLAWTDASLFALGFVSAFLSAWVCIRWLLRYVATHDFVPFAWYRIVFGLLVLTSMWGGWVAWTP